MTPEDERLAGYLDGELPLDALPPALRDEAERFRQLIGPGQDPVRLPPWVGANVMRRIRADQERSLPTRLARWLLAPKLVQLRPIVGLGLVLMVIGLTWALRYTPAEPPPAAPIQTATGSGTSTTRFVLLAPAATSVAVTGDFLNWAPEGHQLTRVRDGLWVADLRLTPGIHQYSFIVNGTEWQPDPQATASVDDGFGQRNSVLIVPDRRS